MWNSFDTADYSGMIAETITIKGHDGRPVRAYFSRPLGKESVPGIVLIPHMPGWDEYCREASRRFSEHGYAVICPNIYEDYGHGTPVEVSARMRNAGIVPDSSVMEDCSSALSFLRSQPNSNGKTGVIGMCSGGRHTFLAACTLDGIDAAADLWGGGVACSEDQLTPSRPKAPIDFAAGLSCPLIGIFGNDDRSPDRDEVNRTEEVLKSLGKDYRFYRYDGAGHGIWYYDKPMYRQEAAMDSFNKVLDFFDEHLKKE
ncbi:MAG: dienelactone hydrolase family protein [Solobacterium sp.]|nr:dienelactone hydrolase family protein [Solobacterium sp.]